MSKRVIACLYCVALITVASAQYTHLPVIPGNNFMVTDLGAVGDGKTLNTKSIQLALDKAGKEGGTVIIPKGVFLCGPLTMYGKTALQLQKGAVLRLRNDVDSFPAANEKYLNFINISGVSDIKISGEGTIDGQGETWWKKFTAKEITFRRPQMMFIDRSERIEIEGITYLNPPNTHLSLKDCKDVYIHAIRILAPDNSRNTDGINISAQNCTIEGCDIRTGDDNIAINFGNKDPKSTVPECSNIVIRNCFFGVGHGLSIGSYTSGGLSNLAVSNCKFDGTTSAIRIKSARGRGGIVENISYTDIAINNSKWPVFISAYYPKEPATPEEDTVTVPVAYTPIYRNISLKNITVTNATDAIKVWGLPESPIENLTFDNVKITSQYGAKIYNARHVKFSKSGIIAAKDKQLQTFHADVEGLNE